ncbi:MAG: hypothetical protein HOO86_06870 [Bacteroidales bacterium]|nr:hypothetical protein [Bacteroidales bacterium]
MKNSMSEINHKKLLQWVPAILVFAFIFPFFKDVLLSPGSFLLLMGSDGIKNYYTYSWYIVNNKELLNFTGMNYPYGESIFYLDSQPFLSVMFYFIKNIFPGFGHYIIALLNLIIIFSPVISAFVLFHIFKVLKVSTLLSITASVGIALLSPQFHRFASHFALSFSFFIPVTIYLLIKDDRWRCLTRNSVSLSVFTMVMFLVHAYLGMIVAFMTALFFMFRFLIQPDFKSFKIHFIKATVISILPSVIFFLLISLTDSHTGRNTNPSGFFTYVASFVTILFQSEPFAILKIHFSTKWEQWEGWAYIGLFSIVFFVPSVILLIYRRLKHLGNDTDSLISGLLFASLIMLAFSFSFPFNMGLEHWVEAFPIIKKFRSVGRFAWVFYYVSGVLAVWFLNSVATTKFRKLIIGVLPILFVIEAFPVYKSYAKFTNKTPNLFDINMVGEELKEVISEIESKNYQAILPLPYYHIGSENYGKIGASKVYKESMIISYHTRLPLFSTYLTHTSIWESKNCVQLLSPVYYDKAIKESIPNTKDILIYWSNEPINQYEKDLLKRSTEVFRNPTGSLYRISIHDLFSIDPAAGVLHFEQIKQGLTFKNDHYLKSGTATFYYDNFDRLGHDTVYSGSGSYLGYDGMSNLLARLDSGFLAPNRTYILSYWKYNKGKNFGQGMLNALGIVTENKGWIKYAAPKWSCVINGDWTLFELEFTPKLDNSLIEIWENEYSISTKGIKSIIDELLIYEKNDTIYREIYSNNGEFLGVFMNNHPLLKKNIPYLPSKKDKEYK